jgi:hypothetical protein
MSDIGLYDSLYIQLRAYADKFDRGLIVLRSHSDILAERTRLELAVLLRELANKDTTNPAARFISVILGQELIESTGQGLSYFISLAQDLETRNPTSSDLHRLEQIATVLDQECTNAVARMRGQI